MPFRCQPAAAARDEPIAGVFVVKDALLNTGLRIAMPTPIRPDPQDVFRFLKFRLVVHGFCVLSSASSALLGDAVDGYSWPRESSRRMAFTNRQTNDRPSLSEEAISLNSSSIRRASLKAFVMAVGWPMLDRTFPSMAPFQKPSFQA